VKSEFLIASLWNAESYSRDCHEVGIHDTSPSHWIFPSEKPCR
jgi:hypothetical protein